MVAEGGGGADGVSTTMANPAYQSRDELLSLRVVVGTKRIFLALCENDRGRYLKISDGRSKLIVPGPGIGDFHTAVEALHEYVSTHPDDEDAEAVTASGGGEGGRPEPLHAERFISEGKKFYLDLLSNERGRYVKMSQATSRRISMTLPAGGLVHLRSALVQLEELAPEEVAPTLGHTTRTVERTTQLAGSGGASVVVKAVQRELRVEGKRVVFETGANRRGAYLRITDTSGGTKMSVTVPHSSVSAIIALLKEVEESDDPEDTLRAAEAAIEEQ